MVDRAKEVRSLMDFVGQVQAEKKLTRREIAQLLGVKYATINGWYGADPIRWPGAKRIAAAWQVLQSVLDGDSMVQYKVRNGVIEEVTAPSNIVETIAMLAAEGEKLARQIDALCEQQALIDETLKVVRERFAKIDDAIVVLRELEVEK